MDIPAPGPKAVPGIVIRAERCEKCKWMQPLAQGEMQCRRFPPTFVAFAMPTPQGVKTNMLSNWPPTRPDSWCGEFKPRIDGVN
jgi:hypothetical protein